MKKTTKTLIRLCGILAFGYIGLIGSLYLNQRNILYNPNTDTPDISQAADNNATSIDVPTADGLILRSWYWSPAKDKPVILFFHGNTGHIGSRAFKAKILNAAGYGVLLAEYRGFGGNDGHITQDGLYQDAHAHIDWLNEQGINTHNIIVYGESLGTGVATYMARHHDVRAAILEAPYTSIMAVASERYPYAPVRALLKDKFLSLDHLPYINAPVLIVHGTQDQTIPLHHGQQMHKATNEPKHLVILNAGHNNLYDHGADTAILNFLQNLGQDMAQKP